MWVMGRILQPDEQYLILLTDATLDRTWEFGTQATSLRLPAEIIPSDGRAHTINWKIGIARKSAEDAYVLVGPWSVIYTFTWQGQ